MQERKLAQHFDLPAMIGSFLLLAVVHIASTSFTCAQTPTQTAAGAATASFHYVVDPSIVKKVRMYRESDDSMHAVAMVKDDKGVSSSFVEDEIVVRNEPAYVAKMVAKYHARVVRDITVKLTSAEGKPLPPVHITPMTVLAIDASTSSLRVEEEAPKIKLGGAHTFSTQKSANLAAIVAHERAAGHSLHLYFLGESAKFPTSSQEQADQNGVSDAYQWPEFDHRAWQYVAAAGIKSNPLVAILDGGFWLNSKGVPCGYEVDALCGTSAPAAGNSDLPMYFEQGDATGIGFRLTGGENPASCSGGGSCPWHGNASASVALGKVDNGYGAAGMGGPVAVPFLIKTDASFPETAAAIDAAVSQGAKVISISSGGSCNSWCLEWFSVTGSDMGAPISAYAAGSFVVASAGNDAQDAGNENVWPCIASFCVGAMDDVPVINGQVNYGYGYYTKNTWMGVYYSNFGPAVKIWAPTNIHAMPNGTNNGQLVVHTGTSASAPYVAGVAALMYAVNPNLTTSQVYQYLEETSTGIVTSEVGGEIQPGKLISPLDAVVAANGGKEMPPQIAITSPNNGATVGQELWHPVQFTATASDIAPATGLCPALLE
jgi:hypothetical protein